MPRTPPRPCGRPGCPELTHTRYCKKHQAEMNKTYDMHQRDRELKRFYDGQPWERIRQRKLAQDPFCEECLRGGRRILATIVDHIVEIKDGGARLDMDNLQSLCHSCHSRKTMRERNRRGVWISKTKKEKTGQAGTRKKSQNQKSNAIKIKKYRKRRVFNQKHLKNLIVFQIWFCTVIKNQNNQNSKRNGCMICEETWKVIN